MVKITNLFAGVSLLFSSAWLGPVISWATGYDSLIGLVSMSTVVAFMGGCLFYRGVVK